MRIATWNVNSIRARVERVLAFLERADVDALAMQEIKCRPDQFPAAPFERAGYALQIHGADQWNGVAIASRVPMERIADRFPAQPAWGDPPRVEARALGARLRPAGAHALDLWSVYVPNGRELTHPHYRYKLAWLAALRDAAAEWVARDPALRLALAGDWNVAPLDRDVWDMGFFEGRTHVSAPERAAFRAFEDAGLAEVTRGRATNYTYWDYQQLRFPRNQGMRIDFVYASRPLAEHVAGASIERDERKGKGASDHVPVIVDVRDPLEPGGAEHAGAGRA